MKSTRKLSNMLAAALVAAALGGCATESPKPPPASLQQQLESAHSRSDHQALATYYEQQAASARGRAEDHRRMLKSYAGAPVGKGGFNAQQHCGAIVTQYDTLAIEYAGLADYHRQLAEGAKP